MEKLLVERVSHAQELRDRYYGRMMSYSQELRKENKSLSKKVHEKAYQFDKYFYSAKHTDKPDLVLYYTDQMELVVNQVNKFNREV